ncbi:hypothetical protein [Bradyrhizobium sp. RDM4]|uniref:hypothetical protein n=1 Tax=Bradyrhizobium sp. RDM4 TaxID=3378765 RepID=UPI0038FD1C2E
MSIESLVHFPEVATALGFEGTRAVKALCERHSIPVVRLNKRQYALRTSDYSLLLARATNQAEAA